MAFFAFSPSETGLASSAYYSKYIFAPVKIRICGVIIKIKNKIINIDYQVEIFNKYSSVDISDFLISLIEMRNVPESRLFTSEEEAIKCCDELNRGVK